MTKTPGQISTDSIEWKLADKLAFIFYNAAGESMNQTLYRASVAIAEVYRQIEAEARASMVEQVKAKIGAIWVPSDDTSEPLDHGYLNCMENVLEELRELEALAALPPTHQVVPVEPTEAMIDVGYKAFGAAMYHPDTSRGWGENASAIYKAMLAASKGEV